MSAEIDRRRVELCDTKKTLLEKNKRLTAGIIADVMSLDREADLEQMTEADWQRVYTTVATLRESQSELRQINASMKALAV